MSLFESHLNTSSHRPLAEQLRPQTLEEFVGQEQVWRKNSALLRNIESGTPQNLILWGPPGSGKTSLARMIQKYFSGRFVARSAIDTGAKELRELGVESRQHLAIDGEKSLLFIDEIHRLNKAQQDVLLPHVEAGDFTLIGATTENPSYALNSALLSRCKLVVFERLSVEALTKIAERVCRHSETTFAALLDSEAQSALLNYVDGDARKLIQSMDELVRAHRDTDSTQPYTTEGVETILGDRSFRYDRNADNHYDIISAFIKSVRGSDPDAAVYWLVRMLKGGEDPLFIARRLIILASEDVGNADPRALSVAVSGAQAVEMIGLPEGAITLAQVTTYLASCPKSNRSYESLRKAQAEVESSGTLQVPLGLRSSKKSEMKKLGYGEGYKYPHDYPMGWTPQSYLPEKLVGKQFYNPAQRGFEKTINEYLQWLKKTDQDK